MPVKQKPKTTTGAAWSALGAHTVTLPSSAVVKIRIPDLSTLLAGDAVPEQLREVAFEEIRTALRAGLSPDEVTTAGDFEEGLNAERLRGLHDLTLYLVSQMLVEPSLSEDELRDAKIPNEDLAMLSQIASRERTVDARGVQIGVEPLDRWDLFRQAHECPAKCEACAEVLAALSSVDVE